MRTDFLERPGSFLTVAAGAARDDVFPVQAAALAARNDVIEAQIARVKVLATVLTAVLVAQKDVAARKGGLLLVLLNGNVVIESNDGRQGYFHRDSSNGGVLVDVYHSDLSGKDSLDGFLPVPQTEWQVRQGLVIGVENECRVTIQFV